jgi:hypothetical protein
MSVSGSRTPIVASSAPAPSGIVASTAGNLIINFALFSGEVYTKANNTLWSFPFGEGNSESQRLQWNGFISNTWTLDLNNGDGVATNPSTNSAVIPTTGWIYTIGDGPAVTIAVIPSGIPVASTSTVIVSNSPDGFNGTYNKINEAFYQQTIDGNKQIVWNSGDVPVANRWALANFDTNFYVVYPTGSDQNQIPISGWPNGETITAA